MVYQQVEVKAVDLPSGNRKDSGNRKLFKVFVLPATVTLIQA
jgi:hypothetical protein